jgi:hypothetical protein
MRRRILLALACLPCAASAAPPASLPASPTEAVDAFHQALETRDAARALALLGQGLIVCEYGVIDPSRDAYAFTHLPIDMQLATRARWTLKARRVGGVGPQKWVVSSYHVVGAGPDNKPIDQTMLETVIAQRVGGFYSIAHIHWSSAPTVPLKPAAPSS